jgi:general L-amino acid transport system permease protein
MSADFGYTVQPQEGGGEIMQALAEADAPRHGDLTPRQWIRSNLFNTWYNSLITVVFGAFALWAGYYALRFVFVTARWEPVRVNMELFMVGTFPRDELTRIVVQMLLMSGAAGLLVGWSRGRAEQQALDAGLEVQRASFRELLSSYFAIALFVIACLVIGVRTIGPVLVVIGCVVAGITGYLATRRLPLVARLVLLSPLVITAVLLTQVGGLDNTAAYVIAVCATVLLVLVNLARLLALTLSAGLLAGVVSFQALSGTDGISWVYLGLALFPITLFAVGAVAERMPTWIGWLAVAALAGVLAWQVVTSGIGLIALGLVAALVAAAVAAARRQPDAALRLAAMAFVWAVAYVVARWIDLPGIDWGEWSGLHLSIIVAAAAIVLAFPFGLLLALARRSSLPVLRGMATTYIEIIRGVPLISLLLMGQFFIGFFLNTDTPLSNVTRATAAITVFSAAYIAEIVRGGLQSVDRGQTEAGQSLGLSPGKITRLLVLPQALRAVIPAMVGQFISLFKDTSLLTIIAITEFLGVREIVHAQAAFRGFGIAETLVFVAFGYWAISFTMSRESQRLERRLGVGVR